MSRRTVKVTKPTDSSPLLAYFVSSHVIIAESTELRESQRKQTVRETHDHHVSVMFGTLGNSPYLAPVRRRKPTITVFHNGQKGKSRFDEYTAKDISKDGFSLHLSIPEVIFTTSTSILDMENELKKQVSFHPSPIKVAKSSTQAVTCSHRQLLAHRFTWKHLQPVLNQSKTEVQPCPAVLPKPQNPLFTIHPVVHLLRIDTEELQDSPRDVEEVLAHIKRKKRQKKTKLQRTSSMPQSKIACNFMAKYNEETAQVMSDTRSLARR